MPSPRQQQQHNLFVYGSLLANEVLARLLGRVPTAKPAVLHGFRRSGIRNRTYPAIVPADQHNNVVHGKVIIGLSDEEHDLLDYFEDVEYEKKEVLVNIIGDSDSHDANYDDPNYNINYPNEAQHNTTSEQVKAFAYVWSEALRDELNGAPAWSYAHFRQTSLAQFLDVCDKCKEEFHAQKKKKKAKKNER